MDNLPTTLWTFIKRAAFFAGLGFALTPTGTVDFNPHRAASWLLAALASVAVGLYRRYFCARQDCLQRLDAAQAAAERLACRLDNLERWTLTPTGKDTLDNPDNGKER